MKTRLYSLSLVALCAAFAMNPLQAEDEKVSTALDYKMNSITGKEVDLSTFKGKVVLMVNVASRCGATPQYGPLQNLYTKYKDDGLVVIGFPCNQFGKQEPGSSNDIQEFCEKNYGVEFPMMEKIAVNGEAAAPLYKHLTAAETKPKKSGPIGWNFEKFLIGKDGNVVARYGTQTQPDDAEVVDAIKAELAK